MQFSTKCWSEHILSAHKATKDLKLPLYMTFKHIYPKNLTGTTEPRQANLCLRAFRRDKV